MMQRVRRLSLGLALLAMPLLEIALLIRAGQKLGFWATMAIIIGTGVLGMMILLRQRFAVVSGVMAAVNEGKPPLAPVLDGAFLVLAGGLLISPGLISDALGLLLLVPPIRRWIAGWSISRMAQSADIEMTILREGGPRSTAGGPIRDVGKGSIIEGEFERLDEDGPDPGPDPGQDPGQGNGKRG